MNQGLISEDLFFKIEKFTVYMFQEHDVTIMMNFIEETVLHQT